MLLFKIDYGLAFIVRFLLLVWYVFFAMGREYGGLTTTSRNTHRLTMGTTEVVKKEIF